MIKNKKRILIAIIVIFIFFFVGIFAVHLYKIRNSVELKSYIDCVPDSVVYYYQKDPLWKDDSLGDSSFHMGDSGCLTSCIAAQINMQDIKIDEIDSDITPGTLNQFFSEHQVYDSEGNIQWNALEDAINFEVVGKDAADLEDDEIETLLKSGYYPIACVRMNGSGNYHFVLIVGSKDGVFLCMDPLNKNHEPVSLSEFGERIYSIRYINN